MDSLLEQISTFAKNFVKIYNKSKPLWLSVLLGGGAVLLTAPWPSLMPFPCHGLRCPSPSLTPWQIPAPPSQWLFIEWLLYAGYNAECLVKSRPGNGCVIMCEVSPTIWRRYHTVILFPQSRNNNFLVCITPLLLMATDHCSYLQLLLDCKFFGEGVFLLPSHTHHLGLCLHSKSA